MIFYLFIAFIFVINQMIDINVNVNVNINFDDNYLAD